MSKSFLTNVFYSGIAKYSNVIISIFVSVILARLLSPEEFGVVALVTVFINFFVLIGDFGFGPAVVQNQSLNDKDVASIFSFTLLFSLFISLVFFFSSGMIASFFNKPVLVPITRLLAISVFFNALQIIPMALLQKRHMFKQLGIITLSSQFFGGAIAIVAALNDYSYYSLVIKSIVSAVITFGALVLLSKVSLVSRIDISSIKRIWHFSIYQFLFSVINYFSRNADNILIGKFFGSTSLGYYEKSYQTMLLPVQNITHVITPVLMPYLAKHQKNKPYVFTKYLEVIRLLSLIGFTASIFLYFTAEEIILIMYGSQWEASIPIFKILALTIGVQMVLSSVGGVFQAVDKTKLMFVSGLLSACCMLGGMTYGIFLGGSLINIGYGLFCAFVINFIQSFYILIKFSLKSSLITFYKVLTYPILISLVIGLVLYLYTLMFDHGIYVSMICKLLLTGILFVIFVLLNIQYRTGLTDFLNKVRKSTSSGS